MRILPLVWKVGSSCTSLCTFRWLRTSQQIKIRDKGWLHSFFSGINHAFYFYCRWGNLSACLAYNICVDQPMKRSVFYHSHTSLVPIHQPGGRALLAWERNPNHEPRIRWWPRLLRLLSHERQNDSKQNLNLPSQSNASMPYKIISYKINSPSRPQKSMYVIMYITASCLVTRMGLGFNL